MKRRSFLKIVAGAACAVAAGLELSLTESLKPQKLIYEPPTARLTWAVLRDIHKKSSEEVWYERERAAWMELAT